MNAPPLVCPACKNKLEETADRFCVHCGWMLRHPDGTLKMAQPLAPADPPPVQRGPGFGAPPRFGRPDGVPIPQMFGPPPAPPPFVGPPMHPGKSDEDEEP